MYSFGTKINGFRENKNLKIVYVTLLTTVEKKY